MTTTGLADWIVASVPLEGLSPAGTLGVIAMMTIVLSNFMSNTAVANMLMAIGLGMASSGVAVTNGAGETELVGSTVTGHLPWQIGLRVEINHSWISLIESCRRGIPCANKVSAD